MTLEAPSAHDESAGPESGGSQSSRIEERAASVALAFLPGALIVYFSFEGGGFFAGSVAFANLVVLSILVVRILCAENPFAGVTRPHAIVSALFAGYAVWTLASALWSHTVSRALVEFDRALLYLLLLLLFGCLPRRVWRIPLMVRCLAAGSLFVCTVSLVTRLLPNVWPTGPGVADNRLSYPITYWNALGILAAIGALLLLGIASNSRERIGTRALASAGVPIILTTLYFTFSRGAMAALLVGLGVFLLSGHSRGTPGALIAIAPAAAIALIVSYHANVLATLDPTSRAAVVQGRHVAVVVAFTAVGAAALRLLTYPLDSWLRRRPDDVSFPAGARRAIGAGMLVATLAILLLLGAPAFVAHEYEQSFRASSVNPNDLRSRLTDPSNLARVEHWRVALKAFGTAPITGTGADTFEREWYRYRSRDYRTTPVVDAHSLYLQTLSDLGLVGGALLAGTLIGLLGGVRGRMRGPNRVAYAALFSAMLAWAIHAGVDWDWEMPAVTAWVFPVGGAALASRGSFRRLGVPRARLQLSLVPLLLVVAIIPALLMLSESHLADAADAFSRGECRSAETEARSSLRALSVRPQPYQIIGYCDIYDGRSRAAVNAMRKAIQQEPGDWEYHFGLAIADSYVGIDPRPTLRSAERLNPGDPIEQQMASVLHTHSPEKWLATARRAYRGTFASGRLTLR